MDLNTIILLTEIAIGTMFAIVGMTRTDEDAS